MSPQKKGTPSEADAARIRKAVEYSRLAQVELVSAVLDAMRHGASIRETAAVAEVSDRTIIRWRKGQGLPSVDELRAPARERQRILDEVYGLDKVRELLAHLEQQRTADTEQQPPPAVASSPFHPDRPGKPTATEV